MTRKNQFWKGVLLGAIAGGAISLLDKQTRVTMKDNVQRVSSKAAYLIKNPGDIQEKLKGTADKIKTTFEQVSGDISYITEKVGELTELTPQVTEILKETKDTFSGNDDTNLLEEVLGEKEKIH